MLELLLGRRAEEPYVGKPLVRFREGRGGVSTPPTRPFGETAAVGASGAPEARSVRFADSLGSMIPNGLGSMIPNVIDLRQRILVAKNHDEELLPFDHSSTGSRHLHSAGSSIHIYTTARAALASRQHGSRSRL